MCLRYNWVCLKNISEPHFYSQIFIDFNRENDSKIVSNPFFHWGFQRNVQTMSGDLGAWGGLKWVTQMEIQWIVNA